ncbi:MAG: MFS transporter [Anaerolineae bacterium]
MSTCPTDPPPEGNNLAAIFKNRNFTLLWTSQVFGQSAQNAILFVQMVMVEGLTRSSGLAGLMVLFYNLPSILFSLLSGVVIDRFRKKSILLLCNISRVFVVAAFILLYRYAQGAGMLTAVYALTFILSTIGQLSDPAESAMVPLLVPPQQLLTANSVFHLLFNVAQVLGLLFLAPLALKLGGIEGAFATISLTYLITALLLWPISAYEPPPDPRLLQNALPNLWKELKAGWQFVIAQKSVLMAIGQHALITMLTMIIAVLAPGFAARVLGMQPIDAIYIFFSAGLGMFLVTLWTSHLGHRFHREILAVAGLLITGLALLGFTIVAWTSETAANTLAKPSQRVIMPVIMMALALGAGGTLATVAAQTIVQERSPIALRGRVITAEFLFANVVGLIPMLVISGLADLIGIPIVLMGLTTVVIVSALLSFRADYTSKRKLTHVDSR